jgi:hypothetical protein
MPILVKHNGKYYEIPDDVLARSTVSKSRFEAGIRKLEDKTAEVAKGLNHYRVVAFADSDLEGL